MNSGGHFFGRFSVGESLSKISWKILATLSLNSARGGIPSAKWIVVIPSAHMSALKSYVAPLVSISGLMYNGVPIKV